MSDDPSCGDEFEACGACHECNPEVCEVCGDGGASETQLGTLCEECFVDNRPTFFFWRTPTRPRRPVFEYE